MTRETKWAVWDRVAAKENDQVGSTVGGQVRHDVNHQTPLSVASCFAVYPQPSHLSNSFGDRPLIPNLALLPKRGSPALDPSLSLFLIQRRFFFQSTPDANTPFFFLETQG